MQRELVFWRPTASIHIFSITEDCEQLAIDICSRCTEKTYMIQKQGYMIKEK